MRIIFRATFVTGEEKKEEGKKDLEIVARPKSWTGIKEKRGKKEKQLSSLTLSLVTQPAKGRKENGVACI